MQNPHHAQVSSCTSLVMRHPDGTGAWWGFCMVGLLHEGVYEWWGFQHFEACAQQGIMQCITGDYAMCGCAS